MASSCKLLISSNCKADDIFKELLIPSRQYQTPDNNTKCFINKFCLCSYRLQLLWPCISYTDTVFHLIHVKVNNQTGKPLPLSNIM